MYKNKAEEEEATMNANNEGGGPICMDPVTQRFLVDLWVTLNLPTLSLTPRDDDSKAKQTDTSHYPDLTGDLLSFKELARAQALAFMMGTINDTRRKNTTEPGRTYLCKDVLQLIVSHML